MSSVAVTAPSLSSRQWAALELGSWLLLLESKLWWFRAATFDGPDVVLMLGMGVIVAASLYRRRGEPRPARHVRRGWLEAGVVTGLLLIVLFIGAYLLCEPYDLFFERLWQRSPESLLIFALRKTGIVVFQQFLILYFLWPLCRDIAGSARGGLWLAATIFGLVHLPLLTLVILTLVAALLWIPLYCRNGVVGPLIASHFLLGLMLNETWPLQLTGSMTVGMDAVARLEENEVVFRADVRRQLRVISSETYFQQHGGSRRAFIEAAFADVLQRPPHPQELHYWLERYDLVGGRGRIAEWLFRCRAEAQRQVSQ